MTGRRWTGALRPAAAVAAVAAVGLAAAAFTGVAFAGGAVARPGVAADPDSLPGFRLVLNLAAFRVDACGPERCVPFPVAIGKPSTPTPEGYFELRTITWNPWWRPPDSEWARNEKPQPPGPKNWMGRVKLEFTPLVYFHGSPFDASIGRAASHGCVRMHNADAVALARLVLGEGLAMAPDSVATMASTSATVAVRLTRVVPVLVVYRRAEVVGDSVVLYPDVYRRGPSDGAAILEAMARAGLDTAGLEARSDSLAARLPVLPAAVPLRTLRPRP